MQLIAVSIFTGTSLTGEPISMLCTLIHGVSIGNRLQWGVSWANASRYPVGFPSKVLANDLASCGCELRLIDIKNSKWWHQVLVWCIEYEYMNAYIFNVDVWSKYTRLHEVSLKLRFLFSADIWGMK